MISVKELNEIRDKMKNEMRVREDNPSVTHVIVGMGTCGIAAGAKKVLSAFIDEIIKADLQHITVYQTGCMGLCRYEPMVEIKAPDKQSVTYINVTQEKVKEIVEKHLKNGNIVTEYTLGAEN